MPRNAIDPCLICGEIKCRCGRRERPVPKKRKAAPPQVVVLPVQETASSEPAPAAEPSSMVDPWDDAPSPKDAARAAMKARAARSQRAAPVRAVDTDPTEAAIRALMPILHPDDRAKFSHLANRHSDVSVRAATWRQRRSGGS